MSTGPESDGTLFTPVRFGALALRNRIVMAPMTRARAGTSRVPNEIMATHYAQRAGAGLIITEATQISAQGTGSAFTPGIHTDEQVDGWKRVTRAVHEAGGCIALQLWHVGRVSHVSLQQDGADPVAPSAVHGKISTFTNDGFEPTSPPRALARDEIPGVVGQFRRAAARAIDAGFDGVQIHAANGYLVDQFLRDGVNRRTDDYGGSIENRCRFLLDVTDAVAAEVGADRTAVRVSPFTVTWDCHDSDPAPLFRHAIAKLAERDLAFVEIIERMGTNVATSDGGDGAQGLTPAELRTLVPQRFVVNGGYDLATAERAVATGHADAVSFARAYISTPDLAERFAAGVAPNPPPDMLTFYGGGAEGYIDYPAMGDQG